MYSLVIFVMTLWRIEDQLSFIYTYTFIHSTVGMFFICRGEAILAVAAFRESSCEAGKIITFLDSEGSVLTTEAFRYLHLKKPRLSSNTAASFEIR